jgi:hypothetical protein
MKLGMHITAPSPISTAYFINPSHQSMCLALLSLLGNSSIKSYHDNVSSGKVIRKRGRFMVFDPSGGDRRVAVIYFTLITSKPRLLSPSDMYSAGVFYGRWRITTFMGFSDLG